MEKTHEIIPSAKRLIKSLRNMGYDFPTAVADIVDNSIEAGATKIYISIGFHGENSYVRIADNGSGMTEEELKEALRYGSERDYSEEDLGKFGLGLKTASMSQCRCLSVASRKINKELVTAYSWDLDHIEKTNKWEIIPITDDSSKNIIKAPLSENPGTVVLWEKLDRILEFRDPEGEFAKKRLVSMTGELGTYLSMVFHKFLTNEIPDQKVEIFINKSKICPWDPYAMIENKTIEIPQKKIKIIFNGEEKQIILKPYILPSQEEFSSIQIFNKFSGIAGWNQQQGFYIYRAGRMIQSGGWSGLRKADEHTKLCRIDLSFSPELDDLFKINVAKMRVQIPNQIRNEIDHLIKPILNAARDRYSSVKRNLLNDQFIIGNKQSKDFIISANKKNFPIEKNINKVFTLDFIEKMMLDLATKYEKKIILEIFRKIRRKFNE